MVRPVVLHRQMRSDSGRQGAASAIGGECRIRYQDNGANMLNGTYPSTLRQDGSAAGERRVHLLQGRLGGVAQLQGWRRVHARHETSVEPRLQQHRVVPEQRRSEPGANLRAATFSHNRFDTLSGYAQDAWQLNSRFTLNFGFRLDHYRSYYPEQVGSSGHKFEEFTGATLNNPGPRLGMVYALSDDQKTVIKANYGKYWNAQGAALAELYNPNANSNYSTYEWIDPNPVYVPAPPPHCGSSRPASLRSVQTRPARLGHRDATGLHLVDPARSEHQEHVRQSGGDVLRARDCPEFRDAHRVCLEWHSR